VKDSWSKPVTTTLAAATAATLVAESNDEWNSPSDAATLQQEADKNPKEATAANETKTKQVPAMINENKVADKDAPRTIQGETNDVKEEAAAGKEGDDQAGDDAVVINVQADGKDEK